jgi:hypothetical protein
MTTTPPPPTDLATHIHAARAAEQRLLEAISSAQPRTEIAEQLACLGRAYQRVVSVAARQAREAAP